MKKKIVLIIILIVLVIVSMALFVPGGKNKMEKDDKNLQENMSMFERPDFHQEERGDRIYFSGYEKFYSEFDTLEEASNRENEIKQVIIDNGDAKEDYFWVVSNAKIDEDKISFTVTSKSNVIYDIEMFENNSKVTRRMK